MTSEVAPRTLNFHAGPMVWIDCEMTGLNPRTDKIMEIAVLITDGQLNVLDDGVQFIIRTDKESLDKMDEWCTRQHGSSGLTHACLNSPYAIDSVSKMVLDYIQKRIPNKRDAVLAGNSVHADRAFLTEHMPEIVDWLHYRIIDVSSIKELCRRWYPGHQPPREWVEKSKHRALDDIRGSIRELKWYREHIFIPVPQRGQEAK